MNKWCTKRVQGNKTCIEKTYTKIMICNLSSAYSDSLFYATVIGIMN